MSDDWVRQFRKGLLELCVLNFLASRESYGYEIVQELGRIEVLAMSESTLYPILTRLKKDQLVTIRTAPSEGGPPRRYFSLSDEGRRYLTTLNDHWRDVSTSVNHLIQKGETP